MIVESTDLVINSFRISKAILPTITPVYIRILLLLLQVLMILPIEFPYF
jgi:hypothetical protein